MYIKNKDKRIISIILCFVLLFYSLIPAFPYHRFSFAEGETQTVETTPPPAEEQTATPTEAPETQETNTTLTEDANTTVEPTPTNTEQPPAIEPTTQPTIIPTPTMTPDEYDVWKKEKRRLDALQEQKEDEEEKAQDQREKAWEQNEDNKEWVAAHGGSESYYMSGQWEADQKAAESQAASANNPSSPNNSVNGPSNCSSTPQEDPYNPNSSIDSTGGTVNNTATSENNDSTTVSNDNCADLSNDSYAGGISGENAQTGNDGNMNMTTGGSNANGQMVNNGNINSTESDNLGSAASGANDSFAEGSTAENLNTGEDSENLAVAEESNTLAVDNTNAAYVDNNMTVEGTSGANTVAENDGSAILTTGDIELIANMLNILNLNITGDDFLHLIVNIFGQLTGDLDMDTIAEHLGYSDDDQLEVIARNSQTGDDSNNTATAQKTDITDVNNTNTAEVNNDMNVVGTSGGNEVSGNDGNANVVTGRIQVLANLFNFINGNFTGEKWKFIMINVFGSLTGNIIVPGTDNYLNGSSGTTVKAENTSAQDSINTSSASSVETSEVTNDNNVDLSNNVTASGVSGNNEQIGNDDGAHTTATGQVDVAVDILNFLNFNIFGNNWVFLIVNVFGTWMGKIVGFADAGDINAPTEGTFAALKVGGEGDTNTTDTQSNGNGDGSTNTATAEYVSNTTVNNQNQANVNNNMNIEGVSGENNVNKNDGATSVSTGWVEIDANLLNIINMNITGRSWLVVFLNVFGDFMGDLFFGTPPPPAPAALASKEGSEDSSQSNRTGGTGDNASSNNSPGNNNSNNANNSTENQNTSSSTNTTQEALANTNKTANIQGTTTQNNDDSLYLASAGNDNTLQFQYNPPPAPQTERSWWDTSFNKLSYFISSIISMFKNFIANPFLFVHINNSLKAGI